MDLLRYIEFGFVIIGALATAVTTIWTVSAKLTKHDEKQKARDAEQDSRMVTHETNETAAFGRVHDQIAKVTSDIQAQIGRAENDIQRLKRRESEMSDQINKVETLTSEDRKRSDEDRKTLTNKMDIMSERVHTMDKMLTQIHTIVTQEKPKRGKTGS